MKFKKHGALTLEEYLQGADPEIVKIARGIQKLVKSVAPSATEIMNPWNTPTFELEDGFFAIYMVAKAHVSLGFARAMELPDPHGLLEGTGKNMRHVKLRSMADLQRPAVRELVEAAVKLPGRMMGKTAKKPLAKKAAAKKAAPAKKAVKGSARP